MTNKRCNYHSSTIKFYLFKDHNLKFNTKASYKIFHVNEDFKATKMSPKQGTPSKKLPYFNINKITSKGLFSQFLLYKER